MPPDDADSNDPVERAVAIGEVLASRVEEIPGGGWSRLRLVRSPVQPRLLRVAELWERRGAGAVCRRREMFLADQLIVRVAAGLSASGREAGFDELGLRLDRDLGGGLFTLRLPQSDLDAVPRALASLAGRPDLASAAEADGVGFGGGAPNDARFADQWGLRNTGQSGGSAGADVSATDFWDVAGDASGVIVAVLDSGLNFAHPDLSGVAWQNAGEIDGDFVDNDGSGKIDDVQGWDFVNNDKLPADDHGHGSHVSGIIAAKRGNAAGVAGMLGSARILVCKILNASNSGFTSDLIAATTYARGRGAKVMNLSLQNYPYSGSLDVEFTACRTAGIVLCVCAGNQGVNNDATPNYPSSYAHDNIIAVGNHDRTDVRWAGSFAPSNYGATSVDLFAPGRDVLSTVLGTSYDYYTGTSMAAPFVSAVCAALKQTNPSWSATQIKASVLAAVTKRAAYQGICSTGGRLNALQAVSHAFRQAPATDADGDGYANLMEYLAGTRADTASVRPVVASSLEGGWLRVSMPRVVRTDAHARVEMSTDLITWQTTGLTDFSTATEVAGALAVEGMPRVFLRVRALPTPQP